MQVYCNQFYGRIGTTSKCLLKMSKFFEKIEIFDVKHLKDPYPENGQPSLVFENKNATIIIPSNLSVISQFFMPTE